MRFADKQWVFKSVDATSGNETFTLPVTMTKTITALSISEDKTRKGGIAIMGHAITDYTVSGVQVGYGVHDFTHRVTGIGALCIGIA